MNYHCWLAKEFANYVIRSGNEHSIQAPFLFGFYTKAINPKKYAYPAILSDFEKHRNALLNSNRNINFEDLGAASRVLKNKEKSIGQLASVMLSSKKKCERMFRIVHFFKPKKILEFGTSLGLSTAYLAAAAPYSKVITMEGVEEIYKLAKVFFMEKKLQNIHSIQGDFDNILSENKTDFNQIDLAFVDGNHQKLKTLEYLDFILKNASDECVIILDDIRWSVEMHEAWQTISNDHRIQLALDFFQQGILIKRKELSSQYFYLR